MVGLYLWGMEDCCRRFIVSDVGDGDGDGDGDGEEDKDEGEGYKVIKYNMCFVTCLVQVEVRLG